ncbi:swi5-like zinc finger protein [Dimargaris cristalligena]|nr:swi5-like zinc finger protein [Dimargaris cristalligena]
MIHSGPSSSSTIKWRTLLAINTGRLEGEPATTLPLSLYDLQALFPDETSLPAVISDLEVEELAQTQAVPVGKHTVQLYWTTKKAREQISKLQSMEVKTQKEITVIENQVQAAQRRLDGEQTTGGVGNLDANEYIQQLHDYNEIKDIGQIVIGKVAVVDGTTTRETYKKFGLHVDD